MKLVHILCKTTVSIQLVSLARREPDNGNEDHETSAVSIQLVSLARREFVLRKTSLFQVKKCFHSISFSCEKREVNNSHTYDDNIVSIQLVSLARREKT